MYFNEFCNMKLRGTRPRFRCAFTKKRLFPILRQCHHSGICAMQALTRFLVLLTVAAVTCPQSRGQVTPNRQDSLTVRSQQDSLRRPLNSPKSPIMKVDSTVAKQGDAAVQQPEVRKPRSSTVRTLERQTATHAAKNAPRVKNASTTTR